MRVGVLDPVLLGVAYYCLQNYVTKDVLRGTCFLGILALVHQLVRKLQANRLRTLGERSGMNVLIVGGGMSGIAMAHKCQQLGLAYTIYEKHPTQLGGTWRDNVYPGCSCDVPTSLYSFSWEQGFSFSAPWVPRDEVLSYLNFVVEKHGISSHVKFGCSVDTTVWDEASKKWTLTYRLPDGKTESVEGNVVVAGCGQLREPQYPSFDTSEFEGVAMHSARWDMSVETKGKRIACIGTGCTAVQLVPAIAPEAESVAVFQRSPSHLFWKDRDVPVVTPALQTIFNNSTLLQKVRRLATFAQFETLYSACIDYSSPTSRLRDAFAWWINWSAESQITKPELRDVLIPKFRIGEKRLLITNNWVATLERDNVEVVTDGIERLTKKGVLTKSGREIEVDIVAYATGFKTQLFLLPIEVVGAGGKRLAEEWNSTPFAYYGLAVPDFPNFFHLYGPGTNLGHNSIIFMIECQAEHIGMLLEQMIRKQAGGADACAVSVKPEAYDAFKETTKRRIGDTVWGTSSTKSWYINKEGVPVNNWYGSCREYARALSSVDPQAWNIH
eukprot:TRINITY_DN1426_c0_g1_i1.p1 TRINITY_DN1426_c0_g1~~TRINITY_DN1426_c0_g1_i1.p1  ORF type:complete len:572 (+),score=245.22 TRINITY_DN1426_c0_g1_i1:52-1716(+)